MATSELQLIGDSSLVQSTDSYYLDVFISAVGSSTVLGGYKLDDFTVDWSNSDPCVYTVFDPDPTTQTFAFSQPIDTASATYQVSLPNSEATTQGDPMYCYGL